jgi:hypothetical protein
MSYIPKYIIKRMFPKDKCIKIVTKDGKKFLMLSMVNVISPISVPDKIDLGGFNPATVPELVKISVKGTNLPFTFDQVKKFAEIWNAGKGYNYDDILVNNKAAGLTIPVGGKLSLLLSFEGFPALAKVLTGPGDYEVVIEAKIDNPMSIAVTGTLSEMNAKFDPKDT